MTYFKEMRDKCDHLYRELVFCSLLAPLEQPILLKQIHDMQTNWCGFLDCLDISVRLGSINPFILTNHLFALERLPIL